MVHKVYKVKFSIVESEVQLLTCEAFWLKYTSPRPIASAPFRMDSVQRGNTFSLCSHPIADSSG
jgi:hypothetical protein